MVKIIFFKSLNINSNNINWTFNVPMNIFKKEKNKFFKVLQDYSYDIAIIYYCLNDSNLLKLYKDKENVILIQSSELDKNINSVKKFKQDLQYPENYRQLKKDENFVVLQVRTSMSSIFLLGQSKNNKDKVFLELENASTSLYVWAENMNSFLALCNLKYINWKENIEEFKDIYDITGITLLENIFESRRSKITWKMFRIPCKSYEDSKYLYNLISIKFKELFEVPCVWEIDVLVTFELYRLRGNTWSNLYHHITNNKLEIVKPFDIDLNLRLLSLDIETVSDNPQRVPMGTRNSDCLFSIWFSWNDGISFGFFYIPTFECLKKNITDSIIFYNNEKKMIEDIIDYLCFQKEEYILLTYNGINYDIPFIISRAYYFNCYNLDKIKYNEGIISFGELGHIDLYLVICNKHNKDLIKKDLDSVAKHFKCSKTKTGLNSKYLRYIFDYMCNNAFDFEDLNFKIITRYITTTIQDMADYNETDTKLALELESILGTMNSYYLECYERYISLKRILKAKTSELSSKEMFFFLLQRKKLYGSREKDLDPILIKNREFKVQKKFDSCFSANETYAGGFNYREEFGCFENVTVLDIQRQYPVILCHYNISPETTCISFAKDFTEEDFNICIKQCEIYKYNSHKEHGRLYVKGILNCDSEPLQTFKDINPDDILVFFFYKKKGILCEYMNYLNDSRNICKNSKDTLKSAIDKFELYCDTIDNDSSSEDDYDFDEYDDDDSNLDTIHFAIEKYSSPELGNNVLFTKKKIKQLSINNRLEYLRNLKLEYRIKNDMYKVMKVKNSSIYGNLGSSYGRIKFKNGAAAITFKGRSMMLKLVKSATLNRLKVIYIDTDSLFITGVDTQKIKLLHELAKNMGWSMSEKTYNNMLIISKKVYMTAEETRGMSKNENPIFKDILEKAYKAAFINRTINYENPKEYIFNILSDFFNMIKKNKECVLINISIGKDEPEEYISNIPTKRAMLRIREIDESYVFSKHCKVYWKLINGKPEYGFEHELKDEKLRNISAIQTLSKILNVLYNIFIAGQLRFYEFVYCISFSDFKALFQCVENEIKINLKL